MLQSVRGSYFALYISIIAISDMNAADAVHGLPASLSAVFDSSDDDDLLNCEPSHTVLHNNDEVQPDQSEDSAKAKSDALLRAQLLTLSEEFREAGLIQLPQLL